MTSTQYDSGSPIAFTLDTTGRVATFRHVDGETWTEPILGWAIVCNDGGDVDAQQETVVEPILLVEGCYPTRVGDYLRDLAAGVMLQSIGYPDPGVTP